MCRLLGYCTRADASLAEIMGERGLHEFTQMSEFHGDGWGVAWYDRQRPGDVHSRSRRCGLGRSAVPRARPPQARRPGPGAPALGHPGPAGRGAQHPPVPPRRVAMAHNGAIHPQDRLGELLPPAWERQLTGTTDSERYFLHVMSGLEARRGHDHRDRDHGRPYRPRCSRRTA